MEQIKLLNGTQYYLPAGAVVDMGDDKISITILPGTKSFWEIELDFAENNTQRIEILDNLGEIIDIRKDYTYLESIKKMNDYLIGRQEITENDGESAYQDTIGVAYTIILSKPDLRTQVKNLQETVDFLVLEGLEV